MREYLFDVGLGVQSGTNGSAGCDIGEDQKTDLRAPVARDDDVLSERRERGNGTDAQISDSHPGPGRELEILREAAVEDEAALGYRLIRKSHGIADPVKAFLIEFARGELGSTPIAGKYVGAAHADFHLFATRQELQLASGHRQADHARALGLKMTVRGEWCGLRRPPCGDQWDGLAGRAQAELGERIPEVRWQGCCRIKDQLQATEESLAQGTIGLQGIDEQLIAARHIEVNGRRDVLQIGECAWKERWHRSAAVDVERASVSQDQIEVVVAAKSMIPGQPIDQNGRLHLEERPHLSLGLLVRAQHALRIDDAFGFIRRARSKQHLCDGVGRYRLERLRHGGSRIIAVQLPKANGSAGRRRALTSDNDSRLM